MEKKPDLENDLKSLDMFFPSKKFAEKVTNIASQQLLSNLAPISPWIRILPHFCIAGFSSILIVLSILVFRNFSYVFSDQNFLFFINIVGITGGGLLVFIWLDRQIKRIILR